MINPISDGQPVTYELLNQIIEQVNKVSVSDTTDVKQIVEVRGRGIAYQENDRAVIAAGKITIAIPKTQSIPIQTVTFPVTFTQTPYVTLTIVDTSISKTTGGLQAATATVVELNQTTMKVIIKLIRQVEVATSIQLHYIAVGPVSNA
jgi:hypothetical protein